MGSKVRQLAPNRLKKESEMYEDFKIMIKRMYFLLYPVLFLFCLKSFIDFEIGFLSYFIAFALVNLGPWSYLFWSRKND